MWHCIYLFIKVKIATISYQKILSLIHNWRPQIFTLQGIIWYIGWIKYISYNIKKWTSKHLRFIFTYAILSSSIISIIIYHYTTITPQTKSVHTAAWPGCSWRPLIKCYRVRIRNHSFNASMISQVFVVRFVIRN